MLPRLSSPRPLAILLTTLLAGCLSWQTCAGEDPQVGVVPSDAVLSSPTPHFTTQKGDSGGLFSKYGADCGSWNVGASLSALVPRFESNIAFTRMESDGASFETFTTTEFDYDLELVPRFWLEFDGPGGLGLRAEYWQFDENASTASTSAPANGFGRIEHASFGSVDITTTIPSDTFTASTGLDAYVIDVEATKTSFHDCSRWQWGAGLRYASIEQTYFAQLRNASAVLRGQVDFSHRLQGIGPTLSARASWPLICNLTLFGQARGSLLFGDGTAQLTGGEDLDLATPLITSRPSERNDILPIGELQLGLEWIGDDSHHSRWQPFVQGALEGQLWSGAGNASSEDGNLGFVGFNIAAGLRF